MKKICGRCGKEYEQTKRSKKQSGNFCHPCIRLFYLLELYYKCENSLSKNSYLNEKKLNDIRDKRNILAQNINSEYGLRAYDEWLAFTKFKSLMYNNFNLICCDI